MKFYIFKEDYLTDSGEVQKGKFIIDHSTSVVAYKKWFLNSVSRFGKIILLDEQISRGKLVALLKKPGAIFLLVHNRRDKIDLLKLQCRMLHLSLGTFLLPEAFSYIKEQSSSRVTFISTQLQLDRLKSCFGNLAPQMAVFPPKIDFSFYTLPTPKQCQAARKKENIKKGEIHIVYAGRLIATKGICQLIRMLDIWPLANVVVTLAGDIEKESRIFLPFIRHAIFSDFLREEVLMGKSRPWLRLQPARDKESLRELFWSADLFVNPSIQPDENFGITPREALACGVPVVTTKFCGLQPLAEIMPWGGIDTYPTLFGLRFSLKQFWSKLEEALRKRNYFSPQRYRSYVVKECSIKNSMENLRSAINYLKNKLPGRFNHGEEIDLEIRKKLLSSINSRAFKRFTKTKEAFRVNYIYGERLEDYVFPAIQGIYSTRSLPPEVIKDSVWCGFFRIAFWESEKTLVEFGFPGPRMRRYSKKLWQSLTDCTYCLKTSDEYAIIPKNGTQISIIQELVDLGYLVPNG